LGFSLPSIVVTHPFIPPSFHSFFASLHQSTQITEDVRAYAREHGYGVDEKVFEVGMKDMSKEFAKVGQVYVEETELAKKLAKE